jgi:glycosyltransferase involved in cell wall biosynthesis
MATEETLKISVVITTYKRAEQLDRTLLSLRSQTRQPDEVIVSDDCSPDNTRAVAEKWRTEFRCFRYSRNTRNLYMPGNLNAGMAFARGEYIANLHDADTFAPELLAKWEAALDRYNTAGIVFAGCRHAGRMYLHEIEPFTPGRKFFEEQYVGSLGSPIWGTVMGRRRAYEQLGSFDATFGFISDVDMWMRMCGKFDIAYVKEPLLILDSEVKPERLFQWRKCMVYDRMVTTNIGRIFNAEPRKFEEYLKKQRVFFRRRYVRFMLGRIYHRDWRETMVGLRLGFRLFFYPVTRGLM